MAAPHEGIERPASLEELFNRDPLELTQDDLAAMVTRLRELRHIWERESTEKRASGGRRSSSVAKIAEPLGDAAEF